MDAKRKDLITRIPQDYQDYTEWRLHSHTESSWGVLGDKLKNLERKMQSLLVTNKNQTEILERHDEFFDKVNPSALMAITQQYIEMEDFKKIGKSYIKAAGIIAGFLGALYVIKQFLGSLILFLLPK